jgi:hypothetical protein
MAAHCRNPLLIIDAKCERQLSSNWQRVVHKAGDWLGKGRINHSAKGRPPMRCQSIRRLFSSVAFGLFALAGSAHADIIDFESLPVDSLFANGATFNQATNYQFTQIGDFGLVSTAAGFGVALPPTGNDTQFYAAVNDSSLSFHRTDGMAFNISGFDAAYLAPFPQGGGLSAGRIVLLGTDVDGNSVFSSFDFGVSADDGSYAFHTFSTGASAWLTSATFLACFYQDDVCINPASNNAQFALDNVVVTPVPEPSGYAMMALGLLLVGYCCRPARR